MSPLKGFDYCKSGIIKNMTKKDQKNIFTKIEQILKFKKNHFRLRLFCIIAYFNLIVSSPLFSQNVILNEEEQSWLAENHTIRVYYWQHPPYFYLKVDRVVGISVDLLNKVSKNTGIKFQFENRLYHFADVLQGLIDHEGPDLVAAIMPTPDREKIFLFSKPYMNSHRFIFTWNDDIFISSIAKLFDKNLAVVKDYVVHRNLAGKFPSIDLLVFNNYEEALRAVSLGKATAFICDLISTPAMINEFGLKNLKVASPCELSDHPFAMGIRNGWPELRNIFNKALSNILAVEKTAILNKWSSVEIDYEISPEDIIKWAFIFTLFVLIIILFYLFINVSLNKRLKQKITKLAESEEKYRGVFDSITDVFMRSDIEGNCILISPSIFNLLGYTIEEVLGENLSTFYTNPADRDKLVQKIKEKGSLQNYEVELTKKDGSIITASANVRFIFDAKGNPIYIESIFRDVTEQKEAESQILKHQKRLKELAIDLTLAEEKTRKQIAGDLHDHVGQLLTSSRMQLSTINDEMDSTQISKKIKNISKALLMANQATREAIFSLSPPQLHEIGLYAGIHDWMKEEIEGKHRIKTTISGKKESYKLEENTRYLLFRSVKELMINVYKHARATHLNIELKRKKDMLEIVVQDDGVGFDYNSNQFKLKSKSYGLFSIQERISDLGGSMQINSTPGFGTIIKLSIPL